MVWSLRTKILSAIIIINIGISAFLAMVMYQARHFRTQENIRQSQEDFSEVISTLFFHLLENLVEKNVAVREILQWPIWSHVEDVQIIQYKRIEVKGSEEDEIGRLKQFFLNPLGAFHREEGFKSEAVENAIRKAYKKEDPVEVKGITGGVARPIYLGKGEERDKWGGVFFVPKVPPQAAEPLSTIWLGIGIITAGTFLLMFITYVLVSRIILKPIDTLSQATDRLSRRDYSRTIPVPWADDEIRRLIISFNAMLLELQDYHENLEAKVKEATERVKKTERNLVIAQRLAAMGKLVAGIAHEINNPLGGMLNISRNLCAKKYSEEKSREYLDLIVDGLARIQQTVNKVLQFSPRKVKPREVDLREVVAQSIDLVRHRVRRKEISFQTGYAQGTFTVFGDPFELQQVLMNLLINSVDAIEQRGTVSVKGKEEGEEVVLKVVDDGKGMTQEELAHAFDLFFTTKDVGEGTGLGLSIAYSIVEAHGGSIEIASEEGRGATVAVRLPISGTVH